MDYFLNYGNLIAILKKEPLVKKIESSQNKQFKKWKSLLQSKGIKKEGLCLVFGKNIISEILSKSPEAKSVHFDPEIQPDFLLSKELYKELSLFKSDGPFLVCPTPKLPTEDLKSPPKGIEVLLPAGDPRNLGALIRTSLAFGSSKIILLKEAANAFLPESIKASAGAVFSAPLFEGPSINDLSASDIYTLDKSGQPLKESGLQKKSLRLLIGEEGGLPKNLKNSKISIPISDKVESLNVNSCLSIALYELS